MGIFSSKKKHFVDTSVVRVIPDEQLPSAMYTALVESVFNNTGIVDSIKNQSLNGAFRSFEKMYRFAERGEYFYGLPDAWTISSDDARDYVKPAIRAEVGYEVELEYYYFRPLNNIHAGWKHLYENLSYDKTTNIIGTLTTSVGFDCYLNKMVAVHETAVGQEIEQDAIGTWEASASSGETPDRPLWDAHSDKALLVTTHEFRVGTAETESVEIHYSYVDAADVVQYAFIILNLSSYDTDQEYHQAKYTYSVASVSYTGYWIYDHLTGTHASINAVFDGSYVNPGTYFPFAVFRSEGVNRADPAFETTQEYITTEKLLDKIGVDFREVADAMHQDADINDIDQAVMLMAVPITSTDPNELRYLFNYFSDVYDRLPVDATDGNYNEVPNLQSSDFGLSGGPNKSWAIDILDADFHMTLSFQGIKKRYHAGNAGDYASRVEDVGSYTRQQEVFNASNLTAISFTTGLPGYQSGVAARNQQIFRHQITANIYEEIIIDSPQTRYHIYKDKGAEAGTNDDRMMIPVDYNVAKRLPLLVREQVYYRSLHFIFNSHVVQKIKWYQRGAFGILLIIIAIVWAVYTQDWATVKAAVGLYAKTAAVLAIIIQRIVVAIVIQFVFTVVAELIGPENAIWLAAILVIVGGVKVLKSGGLVSGSTAAKLLTAANGLAAAAGTSFSHMMDDLQDDYAEFALLSDELTEELERGKDLLGVNLNIDPFVFVGSEPIFVAGESPSDYFDRTVHSGNVGVQSLNIVQNYVILSLTLPTIDDTFEDAA